MTDTFDYGPTPSPGLGEPTGLTPSQTVGPYLHLGLPWPDGPNAVPEGTAGAFWLSGQVRDGDGAPVPDALVETWQADPDGRFAHPDDPREPGRRPPGFRGFGRCDTDGEGRYAIRTVKPGAVPAPDGGWQAPHIAIGLFARGLLDRVITRCYFADEPEANASDPVLTRLGEAERVTLLASPTADGYALDLVLQGGDATAFFDL
ncbi:protocatechuate 3,4-dioxygenase subunit alpha [Egibacter rhizosphaerae]|uniref:Protocatechuate 3,4-dioxygenase subunit alpha n=1 Tax=Egibacter rhizosphaerae TaxID=1670831 RepID=A0A411YIP6_9ACTN|nr:protocatechuate 3,4-dioxygenase subunit alpha [Egibacter rhizosphaerae]QBI20999.1 protocatechuate 3,4-dioxygenase subunit alpha [Egibacter rhizosphaerae]